MLSIPRHPFHIVDPSPWPLITSFSAFTTAVGAALYMHSFLYGDFVLFLGLTLTTLSMFLWWRDVVRESTFLGYHTHSVQIGLRFGMILFIVSEIMFFLAFFWAFFHSSLSPTFDIGLVWPPLSIIPFNPWGVPLLNTFILLLSGATVTWAHHELLLGRKEPAKLSLLLTLVLAFTFTFFQVYEYLEAPFSISDGIYGSTFFMATGFHGFHVFVGSLFLAVCYFRLVSNHFSKLHHFGFEAAAWYWHFVGASVIVIIVFLFFLFLWSFGIPIFLSLLVHRFPLDLVFVFRWNSF